ncbi:MAG: hypothetical protein Q8N88_04695, partial [Nanoarchaeota archaeon]|nr:hypothetical protein [Nanoarchaeota archaeon]
MQAIEDTKKKKEKIILIVQGILKEFNSGKINRQEYEGKLNSVLNKRTAEQWIKYYDDYVKYYEYQIKLCDKLISEEKKKEKLEEKKEKEKPGKEKISVYEGWEGKKRKRKLVPVLSILIAIVLILIIIGFFVNIKPIGVNVLTKIGEKVSDTLGFFTGAPGVSEVFGEVSEIYEEPVNGVYEIQIKQSQAVLGQAVKWTQTIVVDSDIGLNIQLPENSENIKLKKIKDNDKEEISDSANLGEEWFGKKINVKFKDNSETGKQTYEIVYETPAPEIEVNQQGIKTDLKITGPDDVHYKEIFSFAKIPETLKIGEENKLKLYQTKIDGIENKKEILVTLYDTNENGFYDEVRWITPGLSDWEGYLIIEISSAVHLDENKEFISDIYNEVSQLDDIWSETINENEYVKVKFEKKLRNVNDITIYPRIISGNPRIE